MPSARVSMATATGNETPNPEVQKPNTKPQTPENLQTSNSKAPTSREELGFGDWDFFGVWFLVIGVFILVFGAWFLEFSFVIHTAAPPSDRHAPRGGRAPNTP